MRCSDKRKIEDTDVELSNVINDGSVKARFVSDHSHRLNTDLPATYAYGVYLVIVFNSAELRQCSEDQR